ncbi:MAG: hypothetical protein M3Y54_14015 [Bacteroidota bacterium]|nr:hypothetical protein [Bacteroidota bacterium]
MKHNFATKRDDAALDKVILAANLYPLMSNVKWVKLIATLVENWSLVQECKVKLIWEDESVDRWLAIDEHTSCQFNYYASAMEAMIIGSPRLGWAAYKEIEWLDFPRFYSDKTVTQDLTAIQQKIEAVGKFQMDLSLENLRLYAYQRP